MTFQGNFCRTKNPDSQADMGNLASASTIQVTLTSSDHKNAEAELQKANHCFGDVCHIYFQNQVLHCETHLMGLHPWERNQLPAAS